MFIAMLGRMCLSFIFLAAGVGKILDWQGSEQYLVNGLCDTLSRGVLPISFNDILQTCAANAYWLLLAAVVCELCAGLMIFLGITVRFGAFLLIIFVIPTTIIFHHFWVLEGSEHELQMIMCLKNLSILGGLLLLLSYGKGTSHRKQKPTFQSPPPPSSRLVHS